LALRRLARSRQPLSSAEAWRILTGVARQIGVPRPSYSTVHAVFVHEGLISKQRLEDLDTMIRDFSRGYFSLPEVLRS
jgi:hypothetical protein